MKSKLLLSVMFLIFSLFEIVGQTNMDFTKYVDPMIGTNGHGHTFPGVTLPYGMIQLSPDTRIETWDGCSGYHYSDSTILGFSLTHYSGTGAPGGGDFMFMPTTGKVNLDAGDEGNTKTGYRSSFSHKNEKTEVGYYSVILDNYSIKVELTGTKRVGLQKYFFPKNTDGNVILDLTHGISDVVEGAQIKIINDHTIAGYRATSGSLRMDYSSWFAAEFSQPFVKYGIALNGEIKTGVRELEGKDLKAFFKFDKTDENVLMLKVTFSKVSIEGALNNLSELNNWDFDKVRSDAKSAWNKELNKIQIKGGTERKRRIFYTSMYHAFIHPNIDTDVDGQFRSTDGKTYKAKDYQNYTTFSLWDTFRGLHPLQTILNPDRTKDFIRTFIERYEHNGTMPIMEFSGNEVSTMIGYHSIPVVVDAYVKGIRGYAVNKAFEGIKSLSNGPREGREIYLKRGFIPVEYEGQVVSRTLEYSFDDWCVAQMAKDFNEKDYQYYSKRGFFFDNLYCKELGFMVPRKRNYEWIENFDPMEGTSNYTEANAYQYTLYVPQNVEGLIQLMGGDKKFEKWMDNYFALKMDFKKMKIADVTGLIGQYAHGNEPSHHAAYLYNYAGVPWKTQMRVREIMETQYDDTPEGISGNDDTGQMSAWYILSSMGFYAVTPGMDYYVIGSPIFDEVTINLENGNKTIIKTENNSKENVYIQSVLINGKDYSKSYIKHADIINGAEIVFKMGDKPNYKWAILKEDRPYNYEINFASLPELKYDDNLFIGNCEVSFLMKNDKEKIRFTLDGTEPDEKSDLYNKPFTIDKTLTIKAKKYVKGFLPSYTISVDFKRMKFMEGQKVSNIKQGLKYKYFEGVCFYLKDIEKFETLDTGIIANFSIDKIKDERAFGYIYTGYIKIEKAGIYTFYLKTNDGGALFIDGMLLVNNDGAHISYEKGEKIALKAGYHKIKVKYFQQGRAKELKVKYKGPGVVEQEIPENVLFY